MVVVRPQIPPGFPRFPRVPRSQVPRSRVPRSRVPGSQGPKVPGSQGPQDPGSPIPPIPQIPKHVNIASCKRGFIDNGAQVASQPEDPNWDPSRLAIAYIQHETYT